MTMTFIILSNSLFFIGIIVGCIISRYFVGVGVKMSDNTLTETKQTVIEQDNTE